MPKWSGIIGYSITQEDPIDSGIYVEKFTERTYYGDLLANDRRFQNNGQVNEDVVITNRLSFVADPFALTNFHNIRYAVINGVMWKVKSVEITPPRILVNVGEVYNGNHGPKYTG